MNTNRIEFAKRYSKKELIEQLDYALALAIGLNRKIDEMDRKLEEHHRLPLAA